MPYYRIRFTCRGNGEIIYLADDEKEARELFPCECDEEIEDDNAEND